MVYLTSKIINKMGTVFTDNDKIQRLIDNEVEEVSKLRDEVKKEYSELSDKLLNCRTKEDFLLLQKNELDRRFKEDLVNCLIYNMKVEELENKYCKNEKGLK